MTSLIGTEICRTIDLGVKRLPHASERAKPRTRSTASGKVYRFDARLNEEQKLLIQRAADLEGRTMTDFVLHSAEEAAGRTIQEHAMLILTARETEIFVTAILNASEPGPVLRKAARQYKRRMAG